MTSVEKLLAIEEVDDSFENTKELTVKTFASTDSADTKKSSKFRSGGHNTSARGGSVSTNEKIVEKKKLSSYKDPDARIYDQNTILMNLHRQKVWNNSHNAKVFSLRNGIIFYANFRTAYVFNYYLILISWS